MASDPRAQAQEVLAFLRETTGGRWKDRDATLNLIAGRLEDGATVAECFAVIARQWRAWQGTPMQRYVRPMTLFRPLNFEQYAGAPFADA